MKPKCKSTYAKLILHQVDGILVELIEQRASLFLSEMLKAALKDTAPVGMRGQFIDTTAECIDNEIEAFWGNSLNEFLDNLPMQSEQ